MKKIPALVLFTCLSIFGLSCSVAPEADIILKNGRIYTLEENQPWASAVIISGNKITAVLDNSDSTNIAQYTDGTAQEIDLNGRLVLPGFIDAHTHFHGFSAQLNDINLLQVSDDDGLLNELERVVGLIDKGDWLTGGRWGGYEQWVAGSEGTEQTAQVRWEPDRKTIDRVTKDNPVLLSSYDRELYLANTRALSLSGLENTPLGGMKTDNTGRITGLIYKNSPAIERITSVIPSKSERRIQNEIRAGLNKLAELGIVEIHDMTSPEQAKRYATLHDNDELTSRILMRPHLLNAREVIASGAKMGKHPVTRQPDAYLRYGGFKAHFDGLMGSHGALLFEPYSDKPETSGRYRNDTSDDPELKIPNIKKFDDLLLAAAQGGFVTNTHAIGPKGVHDLLEAYKRLQNTIGTSLDRYRVIHAQTVRPQDFRKFNEVNAIAEVNPFMIEDDMRWIEDRLGPERVKWTYPLKSMLDNNIVLTFGSDIPGAAGATFSNHPAYIMHTAVNRTKPDGTPDGGWYPAERISVYEAIKAFTINAAYAAFDEDVRGSIRTGKLADLVVVDRNILEIDPTDIINMAIDLTIVNGKIIFERDQ